tara:strand:+ start:302 stop:478 length:177 start_codon:yes stop_codon:yes gene_type:complete
LGEIIFQIDATGQLGLVAKTQDTGVMNCAFKVLFLAAWLISANNSSSAGLGISAFIFF